MLTVTYALKVVTSAWRKAGRVLYKKCSKLPGNIVQRENEIPRRKLDFIHMNNVFLPQNQGRFIFPQGSLILSFSSEIHTNDTQQFHSYIVKSRGL